MARYNNQNYSAEMPPGYGPRDFLKVLVDTAMDGEKDTVHLPKERWQLHVHRERLSDAVAQLTAAHSVGQRRRAALLYQAVESACVILSLRIEQPVVQRQMKGRADRARAAQKPGSRRIDEILVELARPPWRQRQNDLAYVIAGKIQNAALAAYAADAQLQNRKQLPKDAQAIER